LRAEHRGREADFSAERTEEIGGSRTSALKSALLETHLRARGKTRGLGLWPSRGAVSARSPTRDRRLSRHWMAASFQFK
jgi:hypothetical protein